METIKRKSCRAILLTPGNEVLLIKVHNPSAQWSGWVTPGGGLDEGESEDQGLRRELNEELGLEKIDGGLKVWTRFHKFLWNDKSIEQQESFYLIRTAKFEPSTARLTETEMLDFKEIRWWSLDQIKTTSESVSPSQFYFYLEQLIFKGVPPSPIDVGI
jgi:8-oxo-dGTP pyrophosphatase MutT (NUDIX family)